MISVRNRIPARGVVRIPVVEVRHAVPVGISQGVAQPGKTVGRTDVIRITRCRVDEIGYAVVITVRVDGWAAGSIRVCVREIRDAVAIGVVHGEGTPDDAVGLTGIRGVQRQRVERIPQAVTVGVRHERVGAKSQLLRIGKPVAVDVPGEGIQLGKGEDRAARRVDPGVRSTIAVGVGPEGEQGRDRREQRDEHDGDETPPGRLT